MIEKLGVTHYTPLYDIVRPFSVLWHIPLEEFHLIKEGLAKMIVHRMFESCKTAESRDIYFDWNLAFVATKVCSEISRCTRGINSQKMKGAELGVVVLTGFPVLVDIMQARCQGSWYV